VKSAWKSGREREETSNVLREDHEKRKSRPSSFVPEHEPVLGEQKSGSGALRPSSSFRRCASTFLVKDHEMRREDETEEKILVLS